MTLLSPPGFDEERAIAEILTALEYEKRKEETAVLDAVFRDYGLARASKNKLARLIRNSPGFERFFLSILKQVRPFSLMLSEVYQFLNARAHTTTRRASKFLVNSDAASATLEFDLDNFPKELVKFISDIEMFGMLVELRFEGIDLEGPAPQWNSTQAGSDWGSVSPRWDNDFYDDGFFRALSYANTILGEGRTEHRERAETIARPILDRLAAIRDFVNELPSVELRSGENFNVEYMTGGPEQRLSSDASAARFHRVRPARAAEFLARPTQAWRNDLERTVLDELRRELETFGAAINFYEARLRRSNVDWVAKRLGLAPSDVTPDEYLRLLESLADDYRSRLDRVAPVVGDYSFQNTVERFLEFLSLPFWKNRWFLYELWTLVIVLDVASRVTEIELKNIAEGSGGTIEWKLPGGSASTPVATIGRGPQPINCWSQRKTYHPSTKAGLEPDLRLTKSAPDFHDILIVENKDRLTARAGYLSEILDRYVGGTCADSIWLVNYEQFSPGDAEKLATRWPGRRVEIVSNFRPQQVPPEFEEDVENLLRRHLPPPAAEPSPEEQPEPASDEKAGTTAEVAACEVTLSWKGPPRDLDLHAWIKNGDEEHEVSYADKGCLDAPPYAELDNDHMSGDGQETLRISRGGHESVTIGVHNYSRETKLSASNAVLRLNAGGRQLLLRAPRGGDGRWWHAVRLSATEIEVLQELGDSPPASP